MQDYVSGLQLFRTLLQLHPFDDTLGLSRPQHCLLMPRTHIYTQLLLLFRISDQSPSQFCPGFYSLLSISSNTCRLHDFPQHKLHKQPAKIVVRAHVCLPTLYMCNRRQPKPLKTQSSTIDAFFFSKPTDPVKINKRT